MVVSVLLSWSSGTRALVTTSAKEQSPDLAAITASLRHYSIPEWEVRSSTIPHTRSSGLGTSSCLGSPHFVRATCTLSRSCAYVSAAQVPGPVRRGHLGLYRHSTRPCDFLLAICTRARRRSRANASSHPIMPYFTKKVFHHPPPCDPVVVAV